MGVVRKWIFPIVRILLFGLVAVALGKLAFFPETEAVADPAAPSAEIIEPRYVVSLGDVANDIVIDGTLASDEAVAVKAPAAGTVAGIVTAQGSQVSAGDLLFKVKIETPQDPVETKDAEGNVTTKERPPKVTHTNVTAPIAGALSAFSVIKDQTVAVGDVVAKVAPPTFSVTGALSAKERYRLTQQPSEAIIEIKDGPAPFVCTGLQMLSTLAGAEPDPNAVQQPGQEAPAASTAIKCSVPADVRVFPGLTAQMTIAGGKAEGVLLIPTTSVRGSADSGVVWFVNADGETEERPVSLGISDGSTIEVTAGIAEGDEILEFMPGQEGQSDSNCRMDGNGGMICGDGVV